MSDRIVAFNERSAPDPETGAPGVLRDEWRVVKSADRDPEALRRLIGNHRYIHPYILEHRYIRRGIEEPWTMVEDAESPMVAMSYIDPTATAKSPLLFKLQHQRLEENEARRWQAEADAEARRAAETRALHRTASEAAFRRLSQSKDRVWAERWNQFIESKATDHAYCNAAKMDSTFVHLHKAVLEAETLPAKRMAIRKFLAVYGALAA